MSPWPIPYQNKLAYLGVGGGRFFGLCFRVVRMAPSGPVSHDESCVSAILSSSKTENHVLTCLKCSYKFLLVFTSSYMFLLPPPTGGNGTRNPKQLLHVLHVLGKKGAPDYWGIFLTCNSESRSHVTSQESAVVSKSPGQYMFIFIILLQGLL